MDHKNKIRESLTIQSFWGLGDLLFITPSLRKIKEAFPEIKIIVTTIWPQILDGNPFVDIVGRKREGIFLGYPAPANCINPTKHHIISDWEILKKKTGLDIPKPDLKPEIYNFKIPEVKKGICVQAKYKKDQWHNKKIWPFFNILIEKGKQRGLEIEPIPFLRM